MSQAEERYNRGARTLHWLIAALVIANLATGLLHDPLEPYVRIMPIHKATGMTILVLSLARIAWRFTWVHPPYPQSISREEIVAARAVQAVFYGLMIVMPLTGYVLASAGKFPLEWFGLFDLPKLPVVSESPIVSASREAHGLLGWLFTALVVLHVAAALRHHFILKDGVLRRMA